MALTLCPSAFVFLFNLLNHLPLPPLQTFQLELLTPSGDLIPPNNSGAVTQTIKVMNPSKQAMRMRYKLAFMVNGNANNTQGEVNNFPPTMFS